MYSEEFYNKNLQFVKEILVKNGYPISLINRFLHNTPIQQNPDTTNHTDNNFKYLRMPYHPKLAPRLKNIFEDDKTRIAFYNTKTTNIFYGKVKDPIPKEKKFNVVYQLECECNKKYYGQTCQFVQKRIQQHKNDVRKGLTTTGLSSHVAETNHNIKWEDFKIIECESNTNKRCFLEMSNIIFDNNNLNIQSDYNDCLAIYKNLLSQLK